MVANFLVQISPTRNLVLLSDIYEQVLVDKLNWLDTDSLDRARHYQGQRPAPMGNNDSNDFGQHSEKSSMICKLYFYTAKNGIFNKI